MKEYEEDDFELYEEDDDEVLGVDEEIKRNHNEDSEFFIIPDDEELSESDDESEPEEQEKSPVKVTENTLLKALRSELEKPEYRRNYFRFKYRGEKYTGTPLHEINSGKYIMLVDNKMKGFYLNEIEIF